MKPAKILQCALIIIYVQTVLSSLLHSHAYLSFINITCQHHIYAQEVFPFFYMHSPTHIVISFTSFICQHQFICSHFIHLIDTTIHSLHSTISYICYIQLNIHTIFNNKFTLHPNVQSRTHNINYNIFTLHSTTNLACIFTQTVTTLPFTYMCVHD